MGYFTPSTVASTCPPTTTTANLSASSNLPSILDVPKLPASSKLSKTLAKPYPHQYHFHPKYILIGHQKKIGMEPSRNRERLGKIIQEQQWKIAEARRRKREDENAPLCKLCIPNPINTKPDSPSLTL